MPGRRRKIARSVVAAARELEPAGLVVGTLGNVSARDGDELLITPTRTAYATLRPRDLVRVGVDGELRGGGRRGEPSRELALHLAVYGGRADAGAIVHTHSPHAVAWSFRGVPLEPALEETEYYAMGEIPVAEPAPAGSPQLATSVASALGAAPAVLLGRHGVLAIGEDPAQALLFARLVEHHARIAWLLQDPAHALGGALRASLPTAAWN